MNDQERTDVINDVSAKEKRSDPEGRAGNPMPPTLVECELVRLISTLLISF